MNRTHHGFTLIELVIVLVILVILASIAVPQLGRITGTAERAAAGTLAGSIRAATAANFAQARLSPEADPFDTASGPWVIQSCADTVGISRALGERDAYLANQFGGLEDLAGHTNPVVPRAGQTLFCAFADFNDPATPDQAIRVPVTASGVAATP